jgi:AraC-like DNA-binding protein
MKDQFDSSTLAASRRFDYWQDVVSRRFLRADAFTDPADRVIPAFLNTQQFGSVVLGEIGAPRHRWTREQKHVRVDDQDMLILSIMKSGKGEIRQYGKLAKQTAGDMIMYDSASPLEYEVEGNIGLIMLPRKILEERGLRARNFAAAEFAKGSPACPLLLGMIENSINLEVDGSTLEVVEARVARAIIEVVVAIFDLAKDTDAGDCNSSQFQKIRRYALANLSNQDMTPQLLATVGAVSSRTLNRLFVKMNTTPMRWLWEQRLAEAHSALTEKRARTVTEAAFSVGFRDHAHFSRTFKQRYGICPEQLLGSKRRTSALSH